MILPDHRRCDKHDPSEIVWYARKDRPGYQAWYCLACHREAKARRHHSDRRCILRGHPKTRWTWRWVGGPRGHFRCMTCRLIARRERYARGRTEGVPSGGRVSGSQHMRRVLPADSGSSARLT